MTNAQLIQQVGVKNPSSAPFTCLLLLLNVFQCSSGIRKQRYTSMFKCFSLVMVLMAVGSSGLAADGQCSV